MSELKYSEDAEDVMNLFFQVDYMLYVEGPDDICFWEAVFHKVGGVTVQVQDVGGCNELKPYIERIINNELNAIVACDSDLTEFNDDKTCHTNIIKTYGYSIENTFVNEKTVQKVIKNLGRFSTKEVSSYDYMSWFESIYSRTEELVLLDIYNYINKIGISVVGDNAERFMKSKRSSELCEEKIKYYIDSVSQNFQGYNSLSFKQELHAKYDTRFELWLRGHFLLSAIFKSVLCFLSRKERKVSFSLDAFYTSLITAFEGTFNNSHPEYEYYSEMISRIRMS